jgi:hypothetical protein
MKIYYEVIWMYTIKNNGHIGTKEKRYDTAKEALEKVKSLRKDKEEEVNHISMSKHIYLSEEELEEEVEDENICPFCFDPDCKFEGHKN